MTASAFIAQASLLAIIVFCVAGALYRGYRENWMQFFGMASTALSSTILFVKMHDLEFVPVEMSAFAFGVAVFMAGIALKVWEHRPPADPEISGSR